MSDLTAAVERLAQAVDRLDGAAGRRLAAVQKLAGELGRERAERQRLQDVTGGVTDRLDGAIERIRAVLET